MLRGILPYYILQYIIDNDLQISEGEEIKLPPMDELAAEMGISRGKLREEMVVAQAYGAVEMRPGDGTYVRPFDFYTAIRTLVLYGTAYDWKNFDHLYRLRVQLEITFWQEAVQNLTMEDKEELERIVEQAEHKLTGSPVEIPHKGHRDFHLLIFGGLDNKFVQGLLKAYWDAYEAVGLHRYFDLNYYEKMWISHRAIAEAIIADQYRKGQEILVQHFTLLESRLSGSKSEQQ
ncbi:MAG: FadR family transcriptional regulator [Anaerolineae bacterium]|jgi:DNA-binding FadR family transcriptional regulator|nr:FadR family transcriptional regulator [Anaerolineae bacterium]